MPLNILNHMKISSLNSEMCSNEAIDETNEQINIKNNSFSLEAEEDDDGDSFIDVAEEKTDPDAPPDEESSDDMSEDESSGDDFDDFDDGGSDGGEGEDGGDFTDESSSDEEAEAKKPNSTANPLAVLNGRKDLLNKMSELNRLINVTLNELASSDLSGTVEYNMLMELQKIVIDDKVIFHLESNEESLLRYNIYEKQFSNILNLIKKKNIKQD